MERRRHVVNVRVDGLAPVLGGLLRDPRIRSAALVDVDSGMVLDAWTSGEDDADPAGADLEVQGAGHADLVRTALGVLGGSVRPPGHCELVVGEGAGPHHVLRVVPDAHGGLLALAVVVVGPEHVVSRVRRRLRRVSAAALTAGPSMVRRPSAVRRILDLAGIAHPRRAGGHASTSRISAQPGTDRARSPDAAPAPPSALPPGPRRGG
ncbi:MAG TPA: hypothetical protein VL595_14065 [Pseudonocardia sp.]|jgi:hypothetical protein|nr:hypothetical protein [Pseudonocardia sp.]